MSQDTKRSSKVLNRRRLLQGAGAAGVAALAGCSSNGGNGNGNGGNGNGGTDQIQFPLEIQLETNADNDDRVQLVELIAESMEQTGYFETSVETYEWNTYTGRVLDTEYADEGHIPCIGLSGTFNPGSFCDALHHSSNHGQCCNLVGVSNAELDDMIDSARFGSTEIAEDPEARGAAYDEVWRMLADERYSSITHFGLNTAVANMNVHGFASYPFDETVYSYALHAPFDEQVAWLDESGASPNDTDLSDLQEGGTLRVGVGANIDSFDPPYSTDTTSTMAQGFIFEGLTATDAEGIVYPWLAESYELVDTNDIERVAYEDYMISVDADEDGVIDTEEQVIVQHPEDDPVADDEVRVLTPEEAADAVADDVFGMQYRYELHEGVEFSNGEELTAEHVVNSLRRYENSDLSAQTFDSVLHIEEVDEYTVDIFGQVVDAEGERELPGFLIFTEEQAQAEGGEIDPRQEFTPIGTGPYVLDDFSDEQFAEYERNDNYWLEDIGVENLEWFDGPSDFPNAPVIERLELEIIPDNATRSAALQNDEIDVTTGLTSATLDDFDESDDFFVYSVEAGGYDYIQYPLDVEPWDDKRLRQAVNHLVPREAIVSNIFAGWASEAWTDIPELARGAGTADFDALEDEIRPTNEFDPERAAELIEEVIEDRGYPMN